MRQPPVFSRRSQAYPVLWRGRPAVEKGFACREDWQRERELYALLSGRLAVPAVLAAGPGRLVLEYKNAPTLLSELERQGREGFDPAPWRALALWLRRCAALSGRLPAAADLRGFLWDASSGELAGADLEQYGPMPLERCGAGAAAALACALPGSPAGERAAALLGAELGVSRAALDEAVRARFALLQSLRPRPLSGVVLAGGASRRMGRDKARLELGGRSLLQRQVDKLRALGVGDIMVSGAGCAAPPGVRVIADERPGNGPLGGLHACLRAARCDACLVVSVDMPLLPAGALARLQQCHRGGVTVLRHAGREEPLVGVYDREAAEQIAALLSAGERAVRALKRRVRWAAFDYLGPAELLANCNTPEEFAAAARLYRAFAAAGLTL